MKKLSLITILLTVFFMSLGLFASPPRTKATSEPLNLRDQPIGQTYQKKEKPEDMFVSGSAPSANSSSSSDEKNANNPYLPSKGGNGRIFEVTLWVSEMEGDSDYILEMFKGEKNLETAEGEKTIKTLSKKILNGTLCTLRVKEGGQAIKPYDASYVTAVIKDEDASQSYISAFDRDGRLIKDFGAYPKTKGIGSYAKVSAEKVGDNSDSLSVSIEFSYVEAANLASIADTSGLIPVASGLKAPMFSTKEVKTNLIVSTKTPVIYIVAGLGTDDATSNNGGAQGKIKHHLLLPLVVREITK